MNAPIDYDIAQIKIPPNSIEAEQSVLGGLMMANDAWDGVSEIIEAADFYRPEHRVIYAHMAKLVEAGQPLDTVTINASIELTGESERAGGYVYLAQIARNTPSSANVRAYARAIRSASRARALIVLGQEISELGWDDSLPIDEREELAQAALMQLGDMHGEDVVSTNQALKSLIDLIDQRYESGNELTGLPTGFIEIDRRTRGLQPGNLILIAGRPSMGKTTLAMNIVEHVAFSLRKSVLVFSMEMSRDELFERMISSVGNISLGAIQTGRLVDDEWPKLSAAVSRMKDSLLVVDDRPSLSIQQMRSRARKIHKKNPLSLVLVDYLQLTAVKTVRGSDNREQEISSVSRGLKALAKELGCPVIAVSQLNRGCESRADKRPINSDLRESGQIEQDADLICMMYRDEYYNESTKYKGVAEAIWRKFRNGKIGTDMIASRLDQSRFENLSPNWVPPVDEEEPQPRKRRGFEY